MENTQIKSPALPEADELNGIEGGAATGGGTASDGTNGADAQTGELEIPDNWEQPIKDFLGTIADPNGRRAIFEKIKSMDDGFNKKMSSLAEDRKKHEAERKAFDDERMLLGQYRAIEKAISDSDRAALTAKFGSVPQYVQYLQQMDKMASENPAEFILRFCQSAGIDSVDKLEEMLSSPAMQKAGARMDAAELERKLTRQFEERIAVERETARLTAQIEAFAADAEKHPHFAAVRPAMAALAAGMPDASLEELYEIAVLKDPELRAQAIAPAQAVAKAKAAAGVPAIPAGPSPKKRESSTSVLMRMLTE